MDNKEIQSLIRFVAKSGVAEVELKKDDFRIRIKNLPDQNIVQAAPQQVVATPSALPTAIAAPTTGKAEPAKEAEPQEEETNYVEIKSPMIGTFYRKPSPDKDVFVNVGDTVSKEDVVCIIEAMKLFNEIEAEVSGKIVKVLVDDATPVEYGQPLFLVDPS